MVAVQPTRQTVANTKLVPAAFIGGGIAAVVNLLIFFILPPVLGAAPIMVQMGPPGPDTPFAELPAFAVVAASLIPAFMAAGLLWLLGRFTARPFSTFRIIAVVGLLLSFGPLFTAPMPTGTVISLGLMHVVAAVAIVYTLDQRARA